MCDYLNWTNPLPDIVLLVTLHKGRQSALRIISFDKYYHDDQNLQTRLIYSFCQI